MSYLHIPITDQIEMDEIFSGMPAGAKAFVRAGFAVLVKVPESVWPVLVESAVQAAGQHKSKPGEQLAAALGVSVDKAVSAVAALGMLAAFVSSRKEPADQLVKSMVAAQVIAPSDAPTALKLIPAIIEKKPDVRTAVNTRALANSVLPSFTALSAVVDVRIGSEQFAGIVVPVAIASLRTDAREQRVWFQLMKEDVEELVKQLNSLLQNFKMAEELIGKNVVS